jgi:hypothetical protein
LVRDFKEKAYLKRKTIKVRLLQNKRSIVMDWEFLVNLKWPHQGFTVGYDLIDPTEEEPYSTVMLYLGFITIIFNFT